MWTLETRLRYERRRGYDARWWELLSRFGKSWWHACPFLKFWIVFRKTTSYSSWVKLRRHELNCKWRNGHRCRLNAENADWSWPFDQSGRRIQSNQSEVRYYWPMKSLVTVLKNYCRDGNYPDDGNIVVVPTVDRCLLSQAMSFFS